jgi:hypothetical protein
VSWRSLFWWRPPCLLREVILNVTDDPSVAYQGVLWGSRGAWLTFKDVKAMRANQPPATMDGEMVIHRDKVSFLQVLP